MKVQFSNKIEERDKAIQDLHDRIVKIRDQEVDHSKCLELKEITSDLLIKTLS